MATMIPVKDPVTGAVTFQDSAAAAPATVPQPQTGRPGYDFDPYDSPGEWGDPANPRVLRIRDTMHMAEIWVSEALLPEVKAHPNMEIVTEAIGMPFDSNGNLW